MRRQALHLIFTVFLSFTMTQCTSLDDWFDDDYSSGGGSRSSSSSSSSSGSPYSGNSSDSTDLVGDLQQGLAQVIPSQGMQSSSQKMAFVQLTDEYGDPIKDVEREDVICEHAEGDEEFTEVDVEEVVPLSEAGELSASITSVIDYSGSIFPSDLLDVEDGLMGFYDGLIPGSESDVYQNSISKFSSDYYLVEDFTQVKADLNRGILWDEVDRQYTSMYDAIYYAVDDIRQQTTPLRLVVLFTDGYDNDSYYSKDEAIEYAVQNKVPVCVVGVGAAKVSELEEIADRTGCFYIYKKLFQSLDVAFEAFAEQINNFHVVQLQDTFTEENGTLRIRVQVESDEREALGEM